ncbi:MAG: diguanylate cyclase [Spirochaetaceae bacterium]|nr:diguanylate cyclase [Spirochaetaceae bacterium]
MAASILLGLAALVGCRPAPVREPMVVEAPSPLLRDDEREYLERLGPVPFCVDNDWAPYEYLDADGEYQGIAADLVRLIAARSGVELRLVRTKDWAESLAASKDGDCLVLAFLNASPERREWLGFTDPYFSDPNVFITRNEHQFIADPARLSGERLVLPAGTSVEEGLRARYPNLKIEVVDSEREALRLVDAGEADMTLRSLTMAAYVIRKEGLFNLRISGQLQELSNEFRMGVAKGEPRLREILNRGVRSLTPQEIQSVVNSHIAIEARTMTDRRALVWLFGAFGFLSLLWMLWNLSLRRYLKHLRLIIDAVPAYVFVKDQRGRYLLANRWMATAFGLDPERIKGLSDLDSKAPAEEIAAWREQDRQVLESGKELRIDDHPGRRVDGSPGWFQTIKLPYRRPDTGGKAILGVTIDVTELKNVELELEERERRFRHLAQHDGLTDLPNRSLFSDRLGQAMALCRRDGTKLALVFTDLDRFKEVNDTLGHQAGDLLLQEAAKRLKAAIRASDSAGRIGGDEFVLFFLGIEGRAAAAAAAEKVRAAMELPFELPGRELQISASIGVAIFPDDGEDETGLSRRADAAMYRSKAGGRNRVSVFDPAIDTESGSARR